jgi:hypothetical protein
MDTEDLLPRTAWITLKEACALKNLNYRTATNRPWLQPNGVATEGKIGGKKAFRRETVAAWLTLSDEQILAERDRT